MFKLPPHKQASQLFDMQNLKGQNSGLAVTPLYWIAKIWSKALCSSLWSFNEEVVIVPIGIVSFSVIWNSWSQGYLKYIYLCFTCLISGKVYNVSKAVWTWSNQISDEYTVLSYYCKIFLHWWWNAIEEQTSQNIMTPFNKKTKQNKSTRICG